MLTSSPAPMPSRAQLLGRHARDGLGLELVEHPRAAGHRAGVPVLELAAGDEHQRIFGVHRLVRWQRQRRREAGPAAGGREAVAEDDVKSRRIVRRTRVGHRVFAINRDPS